MVEAKPPPPSQNGEFVISSTSQPWAMFCIHVPIFERKLPLQNSRKSRWRRAVTMRDSPSAGALGGSAGSATASGAEGTPSSKSGIGGAEISVFWFTSELSFKQFGPL